MYQKHFPITNDRVGIALTDRALQLVAPADPLAEGADESLVEYFLGVRDLLARRLQDQIHPRPRQL